ncbi:magnesium chelatase subunit D [Proteiniborus ethanoligenes]|uniref:Magnesium chelatase subunit D n=1 Tax=Proteiniborus ethanoligenes TaxID=415015 RepID=A0A1H3QJL8_9FIRM|nr:VWA domain-containing protein [Proteiniborus ethanoligenes]SDZ13804.1 magnesium chelatase subunit D [Proteiniborus ethanoligenes]
MSKCIYPFPAIVGQEKLKRAILLNLVNPRIGGVLISGEKGTGKSTIVRSIPSISSSVKVIELPLNITEDRLIGGIDIEKAIIFGRKELEEGILKKADSNILYMDEVNLLSDSIMNTVLEVASSGFNIIEREGISYKHRSKFVPIGTMNPEEGSIKPLFLDKFGLFVSVKGDTNFQNRIEIIKRRIQYEEDKMSFYQQWLGECEELNNKIEKAKTILSQITISEELLNIIADTLNAFACEGNRTEVIVVETVKAIVAIDNRIEGNIDDIKEAFSYVLPHRMRKKPKDKENTNNNGDNQENQNNNEHSNDKNNEMEDSESHVENMTSDFDSKDVKDSLSDIEVIENIGNTFKAKNMYFKNKDNRFRKGSGRRSLSKTESKQGRYIRYRSKNKEIRDISLDGTLRAAAPYQKFREKNGVAIAIKNRDLREKIREKPTGVTIFFLVDASGSISVRKRMEAVKGAIMSLLTDAYEKRDKVSLIAFRKESSEILLQTTRSVELAKKHLSELPSGGKTPLSAGMDKAYNYIKSQWIKDTDMIPLLVLISDGRANVSLTGEDPLVECNEIADKIRKKEIKSLVIDTENGFFKFGTLKELSRRMGATYLSIEDLSDKSIYNSVKNLTISN